MSFPEMMFLIAVTVVLPITVLSILFSYQKARLKARRQGSDNELTTSELQEMIDGAVNEATAELEHRVQQLEGQLHLLGSGAESDPAEQPTATKTLGQVIRE